MTSKYFLQQIFSHSTVRYLAQVLNYWNFVSTHFWVKVIQFGSQISVANFRKHPFNAYYGRKYVRTDKF